MTVALPVTTAKASTQAMSSGITCVANATGINYSGGVATAATPVCPPIPAGGFTGHKVG